MINSEGPWGDLAASYGRQTWLEWAAIRKLVGALGVGSGDRVLDLATGSALVLSEMARGSSPPREARGIDSSPEMLVQAPSLPGGWGLQVADATSVPFERDEFDIVTASYLLHFLPEGERRCVLEEARRVLRPGGLLGTITVAPPRSRLTAVISAPVRMAARRSEGRLIGLRSLDPSPDLDATGFRVVSWARTVLGYPSLCIIAT